MNPKLELTDTERRWLAGEAGNARALAMRLLVAAARATGTAQFVPIEFAHINSCHWSGQLSLDFAEFLLADEVTFAVPTHSNASLISCATPTLRPADQHPDAVAGATRLMEIYESLGCTSMWTCAPYQQAEARPEFGQHIAGSESNAVSFYNSALGARTNKYGDLLDVAAAIVGRVPLTGLHTDHARLATHEFRLALPDDDLEDPQLPHLLGVLLGERAGSAVPAIVGAPPFDEAALKAIAAAGATSGSVAMFHIVGQTPEAESLAVATGGRTPDRTTTVTTEDLAAVRDRLSTRSEGPISSVCLGTPHFSIAEFAQLLAMLQGRRIDPEVRLLVTTSRAVAAQLGDRGWREPLTEAGVEVVTDTCTYYPPRPDALGDSVMTNSAKWAYYAPGMLGVDVAFGSLQACVETAVTGELAR